MSNQNEVQSAIKLKSILQAGIIRALEQGITLQESLGLAYEAKAPAKLIKSIKASINENNHLRIALYAELDNL